MLLNSSYVRVLTTVRLTTWLYKRHQACAWQIMSCRRHPLSSHWRVIKTALSFTKQWWYRTSRPGKRMGKQNRLPAEIFCASYFLRTPLYQTFSASYVRPKLSDTTCISQNFCWMDQHNFIGKSLFCTSLLSSLLAQNNCFFYKKSFIKKYDCTLNISRYVFSILLIFEKFCFHRSSYYPLWNILSIMEHF